jgi:hypothetical protein
MEGMARIVLTSRSSLFASDAGEIQALQLFLEDEVPAKPAPQLLWSDRNGAVESGYQHQWEQKLATFQAISSTLARRYGQIRSSSPPLFHHRLTHPDAIFTEDRYSKAGIL